MIDFQTGYWAGEGFPSLGTTDILDWTGLGGGGGGGAVLSIVECSAASLSSLC